MAERKQLVILLVENDPHAAMLLQRAFQMRGVTLAVHACSDGADAMAYLRGQKHYSDRTLYPFPRVLITELALPNCSGFDLLEWLRNHPECNLIPKIVLSASGREPDVVRAYQLGTNCYFVKPTSFDELCRIVELTRQFWTQAEIPPLPQNC